MEINTRTRHELKSYFVRNAIPTESNFADLIDGLLNQKDDRILKQPDSPLSLEGAGAIDTGQKPVLRFYHDFDNQTADWTLNLKSAQGKSGFNLIDGANNSRFFIDQETGNVGIGSTTPATALAIRRSGATQDVGITQNQVGGGAAMELTTSDGAGNQATRLILRGNSGNANIEFYRGSRGGETRSIFIRGADGNVGIGTSNPAEPLEVNGRIKSGALSLGPWPANPSSYVFFGTNALDQSSAGNYGLLQDSSGDGAGRTYLNSPVDIRFRINNSDRMILANNGNVGIGTTSPSEKLVVSGGLTVLQQEVWQEVSFQNGWQNYGSSYNTAGYFKDSQGIVHLKGLVKNGAIGTIIFDLPVGYRPAARELQVVATYPNTAGRVDILSNGNVLAYTGNSNWFSLDGVSFRAGITTIFPGPIVPGRPGRVIGGIVG